MIISIGIDISKDKLDIFHEEKVTVCKNSSLEIKDFFAKVDRGARIVMEATGKYHRLAHQELVELGFAVMVINPYQSRYFAKALNVTCKTDAVDAQILALYGERIEFKATPLCTEDEMQMQELSRHLGDLEKTRQDLLRRREESEGFIQKSLDRALKGIKKEIEKTVKELDTIVKKNEATEARFELLLSIPGIGPKTAIMLLSFLRELGYLTKTEIAALAGLAPINNDSGKFKGKRAIKGGRHDVRANLYMPILGAATKHNKRLKAIYERLVAAGKPKKVALTACMRKLLIWANAILATQEKWAENHI